MTFLAAWVWDKWIDRKLEVRSWQVFFIFIIALIYAALSIGGPLIMRHPDWLIGHFGRSLNLFRQEAVKAAVHWSGYEIIPGIILLVGTITGLLWITRREIKGMLVLHLTSLVFVFTVVTFDAPKIEQYGQRAAIDFYRDMAGKDVYVNTLGFKSYAQLFYFKKQPVRPEADDVSWLMSAGRDKEAYFVTKAHLKEEYLKRYPQLEVLYEKNGFVFTRVTGGR